MNQVIKTRVGAWLLERGHTKRSLAAELGMTTATLNNKLVGRYDWSWPQVIRLAEILGCTPDDLK